MSILSGSVSITRYKVQGKIKAPITENITNGLMDNTIAEIDNQISDKAVGWTSFDKPFQPNFEGSSFVYGSYFVFSLREYLSKTEKKLVKDHVINGLNLRLPSTPNVYDLVWNHEDSLVWFFSNLKAANEELETLFAKSFSLSLIRLFPYTAAELSSGLSDAQRDVLQKISSTQFS
jgi:recombination associated protein RdgC